MAAPKFVRPDPASQSLVEAAVTGWHFHRWGNEWHLVRAGRIACQSKARKLQSDSQEASQTAPDAKVCLACLSRASGHVENIVRRKSAGKPDCLVCACALCDWSCSGEASDRAKLKQAHAEHVIRQLRLDGELLPRPQDAREAMIDLIDPQRLRFLNELVQGSDVMISTESQLANIKARIARVEYGDMPYVATYEYVGRYGKARSRSIRREMHFDALGANEAGFARWLLTPVA
jgi:hypothetical protein